jgi:hypothetical protein
LHPNIRKNTILGELNRIQEAHQAAVPGFAATHGGLNDRSLQGFAKRFQTQYEQKIREIPPNLFSQFRDEFANHYSRFLEYLRNSYV